jgi:hypothetical protein
MENLTIEHRLRVFENKELWIKFKSERKEVAEKRRKLHNKGLHNLHLLFTGQQFGCQIKGDETVQKIIEHGKVKIIVTF